MRAIVAPGLFLIGLLAASCLGDGSATLPGPGESCEEDAVCREGFCFGSPGRRLCTTVCSDDIDCWAGSICLPEPSVGNRLCLPGNRCDGDTSCPLGHRCDLQTLVCHLAVKRDLCGACDTDEQCPSGGLCVRVRSTGERFCSRPCEENGDCPNGFGCRTVIHEGVLYAGGDRPKQCIPLASTCHAERPLCSPCEGDWECGAALDLCLEDRLGGGRTCGRACRPNCEWDPRRLAHFDRETGAPCESGCPPGFGCLDVGGELHQCVPERIDCGEYCDAITPLQERMQCGLGRSCDRIEGRCGIARDGRTCSPCIQGSCPTVGGRPSICVANHGEGESFCASGCESDAECLADYGVGFSCRELEGRRFCLPDGGSCSAGTGELGAACEGGEDCSGKLCLRFGDGGLCSGACAANEDCGDARWICCARSEEEPGYDCSASPGEGGGACVPRAGRFGDACESGRPPCESGFCLDIGAEKLCTAGCQSDADCDKASGHVGAYRCNRAVLDSETFQRVDVCFPAGGGAMGADCTFGSAACADGICLERQHGRICSRECQIQEDCPTGWRCESAPTVDGAELRVCLP